jgi:hypothetical protein
MPHGTACNRLRKLVLFNVLQKHVENVCFKCSDTIGTADELNIEHKLPWEGVSVELFWSLDNIAFSPTLQPQPSLRKRGREATQDRAGRDCLVSPLQGVSTRRGFLRQQVSPERTASVVQRMSERTLPEIG